MTDRLPQALRDERGASIERASATPARKNARTPKHAAKAAPSTLPRSLRDIETWMVSAITERRDDGVAAIVKPSAKLASADRLGVYQAAYLSRLVECVLDDYPAVAATLGDERFEELCQAYVEAHPSRSPNLNAFSQHMPSFLRDAKMLTADERVFYAELATLEWAIVEVIHAEAAKPLDAAVLQKLAPEQWATARFVRSDAVRLLRFEHPVNPFLQELRRTSVVPKMPERAASATVVYREGATVWRMDLTPAMTRVLDALLEGETILDALGQMGTDENDPEALAEAERSVMVWFREWVSGGMFSDLRVD